MNTQLSRHQPRHWLAARQAGKRLGRVATILAAVTSSLLASSAVIPAASATMEPGPPAGNVAPAGGPAQIRTIVTGGMPSWQITPIAVGAALIAATLAVLADRKLAGRSDVTPTTA